MPKLQIIGAPQSPFVWACRLAAAEKGVDVETVHARPHSPEVLAINPIGKIPVMRHGDVELAESRAIISYIDYAFDGPALLPRDRVEAMRAEVWTSRIVTEVHPAMTRGYIAQYLFPRGAGGAPDRTVIDQALPTIERQIGILDAALARTPFVAGDVFTVADIYLLPLLSYLTQLPESGAMVAAAPALSAYFACEAARPSFKASTPPPVSEEDRANAVAILTAQAKQKEVA